MGATTSEPAGIAKRSALDDIIERGVIRIAVT
jgi:hypothetical protein